MQSSIQGNLVQFINKRALSSESKELLSQDRKRAKLVDQLFQLEAPKIPEQETKQLKQQKFNNKVSKKAEKQKKQ